MKPTGTGRIVLWRGGSLWIGRSGEPTDFHSHHAIQITLSLSEGGVRFRRPGGSWNTCGAVTIAAHEPHAFEARGEFVGMIFVEPESREGRALQQLCRGDGIASVTIETLGREIASIIAACKQAAPNPELTDSTRSPIAKFASTITMPVATLDSRIERAVEQLRELWEKERTDGIHDWIGAVVGWYRNIQGDRPSGRCALSVR